MVQCKSKKVAGDSIKFHQFPTNKQMVTRWLRALKSGKKPSKHAKVCSLHFTESDYKPNEFAKTCQKLSMGRKLQNMLGPEHVVLFKNDATGQHDAAEKQDDAEQHDAVIQDVGINQDEQVSMPEIDNIGINRSKSTQTYQLVAIALYFNRLSDEQFKRYTGLTSGRFVILYLFLAQTESSPFDKYLSKRDQLIMCLMKYRQNIIFSIIGDMYG